MNFDPKTKLTWTVPKNKTQFTKGEFVFEISDMSENITTIKYKN
jgi:hypothetical protein